MGPGIPRFGPHHHMLAMPNYTAHPCLSPIKQPQRGPAMGLSLSLTIGVGGRRSARVNRAAMGHSLHPRGLGRWECPFGKAHANED